MSDSIICTPILLERKDIPDNYDDYIGNILKNNKEEPHLMLASPGRQIQMLMNKLNYKPQHLYLVSDQEIKSGDWIYNPLNNDFTRATNFAWIKMHLNSLKKIVATSDISLSLPLIPSSFIEEYVAKQGKIDKVRVFLPQEAHLHAIYGDERYLEVIILPIEDKTYSREEVLDLMTMAIMNDNCSMPYTVAELKEEFPYQFDQKLSNMKEWFDKTYEI